MDKTKDIEIEGRQYQIGLLPASVGNWIFTQIQAKTFKNEDTFQSVQAHCFNVCFRWKIAPDGSRIPVKVFDRAKNQWLIPDLADDLFSVNRLYNATLDFNFAPFFEKLEALDKAAEEAAKTSDTQLPDSLMA